MRTGNDYVDRMATMRFEGLKIDHRWLGHPWLCRGGARVDEGRASGFWFAAAYVLAEICYFYSPAVERDPEGHIVTVRKRFKHDLMWQDYGVWASKIGLSKSQLQDIIAFLVQRGLIGREVRPVPLDNGMQTNNQPHIWPIAEKIYELTYGDREGSGTPGQDTPPFPTTPAEQPVQPAPTPAPKRLPKNRDTPHR